MIFENCLKISSLQLISQFRDDKEDDTEEDDSKYLLLLLLPLFFFFIPTAPDVSAQSPVVITKTQPCFLNQTAGVDIYKNCGMDKDFLTAALLPFEYAVGGNFAMILITVFVIMSYVKYHKIAYPLIIGTLYLPTSLYLYPQHFISFALILSTVGIACLLTYIFIRQTRD